MKDQSSFPLELESQLIEFSKSSKLKKCNSCSSIDKKNNQNADIIARQRMNRSASKKL